MDNQDTLQTPENVKQPQLAEVEDTAIVEYLDIVKSEFEREQSKKQSIENRTGLIITLLGAICVFLFEKIHLKDIFALMTVPLTFADLLKIICGLVIYLGFFFTMVMLIETINVKQHNNFDVKSIDEHLLLAQRLPALFKIFFSYQNIILQHRELNEKRAKMFRRSLYGISTTLVAIVIYTTLM